MLSHSWRVRAADFAQPWFQARRQELGLPETLHRKWWEYGVIAAVYHEQVGQGGRVLGLGVGREPLPAWFAARGAEVVASNLPPERAGVWAASGQYVDHLEALDSPLLCDLGTLRERVTLLFADMTALPQAVRQGTYDLVWSACAIEHVGSLEACLRVVCDAMACLKPGGVAVHTTELQLGDLTTRLDTGGTVLLQPADLEHLRWLLAEQGDTLWPLDLDAGDTEADRTIDAMLDDQPSLPHLSLRVYGLVAGQRRDFVTTSVALIGQRGQGGPSTHEE